jgi:serine protease Do
MIPPDPKIHAFFSFGSARSTGLFRVGTAVRSCLLTHACIALLGFAVPAIGARATEHAEPQRLEEYRAMQSVVRSVVDRLRPSLVRIETVGGAQPPERPAAATVEIDTPDGPIKPRSQNPFQDSPGSGFELADGPTTGIVYSSDGYILTSSFNFVREPALISVTLADGRRIAADLIARDQVRKLAMLKIEAQDLVVPAWAPSEEVRIGRWVIALGLAFSEKEPSISVGIISALNRMSGNAFQTDALLSPANYGGPLCDVSGRIMGLAVPLAQRPGELAGIEMYDAGVGFALPHTKIEEIGARLVQGESFYRGWLGMVVDPKATDALVIGNVADPSPMRAAGVKPGDQILHAEGRDVKHFGQLVQALYMIPAGEEVYLLLKRGDKSMGVKVRLARATELGPLPEIEEPLDPSMPIPSEPESAEDSEHHDHDHDHDHGDDE